MEKIKRPEKVTNEHVLERIGEKRTLLIMNLPKKANCMGYILRINFLFINNWIGHILTRNLLHHGVIEGEMTEVK